MQVLELPPLAVDTREGRFTLPPLCVSYPLGHVHGERVNSPILTPTELVQPGTRLKADEKKSCAWSLEENGHEFESCVTCHSQ